MIKNRDFLGGRPIEKKGLLNFNLNLNNPILFDFNFSTFSTGVISGTSLGSDVYFSRSGDGFSIKTGTSTLLLMTMSNNTARFGRNSDSDQISLLIEESRFSFLSRSEALTTSPWSRSGAGSQTASFANGPDGSNLTAEMIRTDNNGNGMLYFWIPTLVSGQRYTMQAWARGESGGESFQFAVTNGGLNSGKAVGGILESSYRDYQLTVIAGNFGAGSTAADLTTCFAILGFGGRGTGLTNITGGIHSGSRNQITWGVNISSGAFATSYIPTPAAGVGRNGERFGYNNIQNKYKNNRLKIEYQLKPIFEPRELDRNAYLFYSENGDYCFMDTSGTLNISISGTSYITPMSMTWNKFDDIDIFMELGAGPPYVRYRKNLSSSILLSLGSPGNLPLFAGSGYIDICNSATLNQFSSWIRRITFYE